jgi:N-hydroxyarylamine O-acetyltransferase
MGAVLDLDSYLRRIEYRGPREPTLAALETLVLAHVTHVPFENLDIQLGRPIRLDLPSLEAKLVTARRGGYCFEQNTLFASALRDLGFAVDTMEARVRLGATQLLPRTHMTLRVHLPEGAFLADVGFGAGGPLAPVPWSGEPAERHGDVVRLAQEGPRLVLQRATASGWDDQYAVEPAPAFPIDFEIGNHYTSTHPESRFVLTLTAQRAFPDARHVLRGRTYTITRATGVEEREIASAEELLALLASVFDLPFPAGTRFRSPVFE